MILFIFVCGVLLSVIGFLIYLLSKAMNRVSLYENFYSSTLDDTDAIIETLDELLYRRQLLSDDPDIKKLYKTMSIFRDILAGYGDVNNRRFIRQDKNKQQ